MPNKANADDIGSRVILNLLKSGGSSIGNNEPRERLLRQARNLYRDGITELCGAVGRGLISVADAEKISRFDDATQRLVLSGDAREFVRSLKTRGRAPGVKEVEPCLNGSVSDAVSALLRGVPDERLEATICQIVTELARVREQRIAASLAQKPVVGARKASKTQGVAKIGSVAD
jgi:hypothetical protein